MHKRKRDALDRKLDEWVYDDVPPFPLRPKFTESLDACFGYLIPKLKGLGYMSRVQYSPLWDNDTGKQISDWTGFADISYVCFDHVGKWFDMYAIAETPALALCQAVEKLIDHMKEEQK